MAKDTLEIWWHAKPGQCNVGGMKEVGGGSFARGFSLRLFNLLFWELGVSPVGLVVTLAVAPNCEPTWVGPVRNASAVPTKVGCADEKTCVTPVVWGFAAMVGIETPLKMSNAIAIRVMTEVLIDFTSNLRSRST